jgi:hypothetical protein
MTRQQKVLARRKQREAKQRAAREVVPHERHRIGRGPRAARGSLDGYAMFNSVPRGPRPAVAQIPIAQMGVL